MSDTAPLLVVVTGMPASGKTTVADALSRGLRLPLITKDGFKERLFDTLGSGDVEWSSRLSETAYALIIDTVRTLLAAGVSVIAEANFLRGSEAQFGALPQHRLVQVVCEAPLDVITGRYANRERDAGHHDAEKIGLLAGRFERGVHGELDLPGEVIVLDTTQPVDVDELVERVGAV